MSFLSSLFILWNISISIQINCIFLIFFIHYSNNQVLKVCKIIRFNPYTNLKTYVSYDSTYFYNEIYLHDLKIKKNAMSTTFFITNSKWHVVIVGAKKVISVIGSNLNL